MERKVRVKIKNMPLTGKDGSYRPKSVVIVSHEEAKLLTNRGHAEYLDPPTPIVERMVASPQGTKEVFRPQLREAKTKTKAKAKEDE